MAFLSRAIIATFLSCHSVFLKRWQSFDGDNAQNESSHAALGISLPQMRTVSLNFVRTYIIGMNNDCDRQILFTVRSVEGISIALPNRWLERIATLGNRGGAIALTGCNFPIEYI